MHIQGVTAIFAASAAILAAAAIAAAAAAACTGPPAQCVVRLGAGRLAGAARGAARWRVAARSRAGGQLAGRVSPRPRLFAPAPSPNGLSVFCAFSRPHSCATPTASPPLWFRRPRLDEAIGAAPLTASPPTESPGRGLCSTRRPGGGRESVSQSHTPPSTEDAQITAHKTAHEVEPSRRHRLPSPTPRYPNPPSRALPQAPTITTRSRTLTTGRAPSRCTVASSRRR